VGVSKSLRTESITKYTLTRINTCWESTQRVMATKLTRLTHKVAIQLHLVAESCMICSSRSRRPVWKLLDTPSYLTDQIIVVLMADRETEEYNIKMEFKELVFVLWPRNEPSGGLLCQRCWTYGLWWLVYKKSLYCLRYHLHAKQELLFYNETFQHVYGKIS
jgi:hypothetical protein